MALQVWLPLNGNVNNQGLSDLTFSVSSVTTINDNGKIGKCYENNSFTTGGLFSDKTIDLGQNQSMFCWFKINSLISSSSLGGGLVTQHNHTLNQGMGITIRYVTATTGYLSVNTGNGTNRTYNTYYGKTLLQAGTWYHGGYTYDGTTIRLYVNGSLDGEFERSDMKIEPDNIQIFRWSLPSGSFTFDGCLNDVRIYDNALSPREIKELSKGLILHYPLADTYIEPTTNLISTEDGLSQTCHNASTSKYGYGTNTDIYKTVTTYDGRKGTKVYMGTNGNKCYPYVYVNNMFVSDGTNSPAYKTLSFDYYGTIGDFLGPYKLGNGSGTATYTVTCQGIKTTGTYSDMGSFAVTPNKWNHVEITFHGTTEADSQWGYIKIAGTHTSDTSNFWFFANMQLETNNHATGYAGPNGVRNEDTVYDVSGYGYNGTIVNGGISYSGDTPRYNVSTHFTGTNYISLPSPSNEIKTISLWAKWDVIPSGQSVIFVDYKSKLGLGLMSTGILCGTSGVGNFYTYSKSSIVANKWYHFVIVNNGEVTGTARKLYIDGVEQTPTSNISNWTYGVQELQIGKRSTTSDGFVGCLSDFRAYNTVLSADDVLELYHTPITLSNNGTLLTQGELSEV